MKKKIRMPFLAVPFLFLVIIAFSFPLCAIAEVIPIKLDTLIKQSNLIIIGKVNKVYYEESPSPDEPDIRTAEVTVLSVLKGNLKTDRIFYCAMPLMVCGVDDANQGEVGLFFFSNRRDLTEQNRYNFRLGKYISDGPYYYLSNYGYGRVLIREIDGGQYIQANESKYNLIFPKKIKRMQILMNNGQAQLEPFVKLEDVVSYIKHK